MTSVLIVDDHRVLREGLRTSLTSLGIDVVGEAGDGPEALAAMYQLQPQVVLLDISLPSMDGIEVTKRISELYPTTAVVVLSMFNDGPTLRAALRAGAVAYLAKDCSTSEIAETIEAVATGEPALSLGLAQRLLAANSSDRKSDLLSQREVEVLQLIAQGATTAMVAKRLYISVKTVKNHLSNIYEKMDTRDRTQAVLEGLRLGIVRLR